MPVVHHSSSVCKTFATTDLHQPQETGSRATPVPVSQPRQSLVSNGLYRDYSWEWNIMEVETNFFRGDYVIYYNKGSSKKELTTYFFKPASPPGNFSKGAR